MENCKIRHGLRKLDSKSRSRLCVGKTLTSYNVCLEVVPLIKYTKQTKIFFLVFWVRQGLTLLLRILFQTKKSRLHSSLRNVVCSKNIDVFIF